MPKRIMVSTLTNITREIHLNGSSFSVREEGYKSSRRYVSRATDCDCSSDCSSDCTSDNCDCSQDNDCYCTDCNEGDDPN